MATSNKDKIRALLKSIETGEPGPVAVVNEAKYVQHNPQTEEGSEGLAALFKRLSATNPRVNVVRAFVDGEVVFGHTEYDFATRRIGFEVFRFEDGQAAEHWDNIQPRLGPNEPRRSMVDGPVEATDLDRTEQNRAFVRNFVENVLVGGRINQLAEFVDANAFADHNPRLAGDAAALRDALEVTQGGGNRRIDYTGSLRKAISYSASAKGMPMASILPFTTCSASPAANWWNTGTRPKRSRRRANGRTITGSFEGLFTARARH